MGLDYAVIEPAATDPDYRKMGLRKAAVLEGVKRVGKEVIKIDHVVYVDTKAKEMEKLINKEKKMIIRGAAGRKLPYGRVNIGDVLYFINNKGERQLEAKAVVKSVFNSEKMTKEQSIDLVNKNQDKLRLTDQQFNRWAGKRYIVLIELENIEAIKAFKIDKSNYGNMDDWLLVEEIKNVKI